jgi:plastocyanin
MRTFEGRPAAASMLLLMGGLVAGCGGDGGGPGPGPSPTPTKVAFTAEPSNTAVGAAITPAVTVSVQDASGNPVTSSTAPITIAIGNNPGGATLGGTTTQNSATGVATFSDLTLDNSGAAYTLSASSSGLTSATSGAFNVFGAAALIAKNAGDNQTAEVGTAVPIDPQVLVPDANTGPVPQVPVTFQVTAGGGSVDPVTPVNTSDAGLASVHWTLGSQAGTNNNTLQATAAGVGGSVTFTASATPTPSGVSIQVGNGPTQFVFIPQSVTIPVGGTVTWVWSSGSTSHNVQTSQGSPNISGTPSGLHTTPFTFGPIQFNTAGTYTFYCSVHATATDPVAPGFMTGQITVQ